MAAVRTPVRALPVCRLFSLFLIEYLSSSVGYSGVAPLSVRAATALAPRRAITIPLWSTRWSMRRVTSDCGSDGINDVVETAFIITTAGVAPNSVAL